MNRNNPEKGSAANPAPLADNTNQINSFRNRAQEKPCDGFSPSQYYRWLRPAHAITSITLPVITVPCGITADGLPVGIQLIAKPHGEAALLRYANYIEQVYDWDTTQLI